MKDTMTAFYLGCAIWGYRPWIGTWLPARTQDMLGAYSERLTMVEINATFYGLPDAATITRWAESTPTTFRFCPKIPRAISHSDGLASHRSETALGSRPYHPVT